VHPVKTHFILKRWFDRAKGSVRKIGWSKDSRKPLCTFGTERVKYQQVCVVQRTAHSLVTNAVGLWDKKSH